MSYEYSLGSRFLAVLVGGTSLGLSMVFLGIMLWGK